MAKTNFRRNLIRLRLEAGMAQADLVRKTGLSKGTISAFEGGTRQPSLDTIVLLANVFGVSAAEMVKGEGE